MEAAGLRRRRNKNAAVGTFLLLMSLFLPASCLLEEVKNQPTCPHGDYLTDEGICCNKCSPGFKLVEKCHAVGQRSNCTACPANQFNDQMNFTPNCRRCQRCTKKNEEVASACLPYQNTVCRCKKGFYRSWIDSVTSECRRCSTCRSDEQQIQQCSSDQDTVCRCKENFYRAARRTCEPCKSCSDECKLHCTSPPTLNTKAGADRTDSLVPVVVGVVAVAAVILILGIFITYMTTKRFTKKKLLKSSSQLTEASPDSCQESLVYSEEPSENNVKAESFMMDQETSNLPDCVPLEIRIPDLIYSVLDLVPVLQVKQLVRCLGVKDGEIEQADLDHRSCREAHYQMLRVWAERGSRSAGGGTLLLPLPLLQELIDKLKLMHLGRAAEELEAKYCIQ